MKFAVFLAVLSVSAVSAQSAAEDPVVVVIDGKEWRQSDLERFGRSLPGNQMRNFYANKKAFLQQWALTMHMAKLAREKGLHERDPYRYRQLYNDSIFYAQAIIQETSASYPVTQEMKEKYFAQHSAEYQRAKVKMLLVGYTPEGVPVAPGQKTRTLAEAQKLAADLVRRARGGEDFAALVKQYSDDGESKEKGGDYPDIKPTDEGVPPPVKAAVFAMKPGQISDAIQQGNGFYIFRLEGMVTPTLQEVNDEVVLEIQRAHFDEWMKSVQQGVKIDFKDDKYLSETTPK